jgi:truncated hemoglobin YjbI
VVVTRRALLEAERGHQRDDTLGKLAVGEIIEGVVKNITHFGVFVDIGGIDGLVTLGDLSWSGCVKDAHAIGKKGQNVRLASKLTGWQLDIKSKSQLAQVVRPLRDLPGIGPLLEQRLKEAGITTVINDFVGRVLDDPKINGYFLNVAVDGGRLTTCLVRQVGNLTGGPQAYPGEDGMCRDMATAHEGLGISTNDFSDLAGHLVDALTAASAPSAPSAVYPTLPSKLMPSSFCASTANSMGSSRKTSLQKPFTIIDWASSADSPRCRQ